MATEPLVSIERPERPPTDDRFISQSGQRLIETVTRLSIRFRKRRGGWCRPHLGGNEGQSGEQWRRKRLLPAEGGHRIWGQIDLGDGGVRPFTSEASSGEHTTPRDAPEVPRTPDAFSSTLIQWFVGSGNDGQPELAFINSMLAREFLREFSGTERYDVPQPEAYPHEQRHPTEYSVRDVPPKGVVTVVIQDFESV
jgi:hypothetical protein